MNENTVLIIVFALIAIGISIVLHEFMHGYVGKLLGDTTAEEEGRLTLNPIKHIDPFATVLLPVILIILGLPPFGAAKPVPVNFARLKYHEFGGALVAIAGPLTNLLLAFVAGIIFKTAGLTDSSLFGVFLLVFISVNIGFFVFNMIPFPPLDGSRVLYAFAPRPLQKVMESIERLGLLAIAIFIVVLFPLIRDALVFVNTQIYNFII